MEKLIECQKEFLFNSRYDNEYHPAYKALKYHCKSTDLRMEIDVDMINEDDLPILIKNVFDAISLHCDKCDCRM